MHFCKLPQGNRFYVKYSDRGITYSSGRESGVTLFTGLLFPSKYGPYQNHKRVNEGIENVAHYCRIF